MNAGVLSVLFLSTALATLSNAANAADTVRIGVSCPMTGGSADMGTSLRDGVSLAADEINQWVGGVLGKKIELVVRDDMANNETGRQVAEELVQKEKVSATIGICNAGVGAVSMDVYQNARTPLIISVSAGTPLAEKRAAHPDFYIFRNSPRDEIQAPAIVAEAMRRGFRRVAIFADSTAYGESGLAYLTRELAKHNLSAVSVQRFPIGIKDLSEQTATARAAGADAILAWTVGPEAAVLAKSLAKQKWNAQLIGSWPLSWRNFIDNAGSAGEGALVAVSFVQQASFLNRNAFILAYQKKFGVKNIPAPMAAAQGYDAMMILYNAIQQAQSDHPERIKAALERLEGRVSGVITTYERPFAPNDHDALSANMLVMGIVRQGQVDYAYKEDAMRSFTVQRKAANH